MPPALFDEETGFFPLEAVLYTLEVKSTLDRDGVEQAYASASRIASFPVLTSSGTLSMAGPRPNHGLFALATDLQVAGKTDFQRYAEVRGERPLHLASLCVADRGYWWYGDDRYNTWPDAESAVIGFLGGIFNALPLLASTRRQSPVSIGAYLISFGDDISVAAAAFHAFVATITIPPPETRDDTERRALLTQLVGLRQALLATLDRYRFGEEPKIVALRGLIDQEFAMAKTAIGQIAD
ncbi:MAG: hypothetical protein IPG04_11860 [Polyangiaceae bacterium]|nr:hypothetical protein [Polyangiaceae bacterium]